MYGRRRPWACVHSRVSVVLGASFQIREGQEGYVHLVHVVGSRGAASPDVDVNPSRGVSYGIGRVPSIGRASGVRECGIATRGVVHGPNRPQPGVLLDLVHAVSCVLGDEVGAVVGECAGHVLVLAHQHVDCVVG